MRENQGEVAQDFLLLNTSLEELYHFISNTLLRVEFPGQALWIWDPTATLMNMLWKVHLFHWELGTVAPRQILAPIPCMNQGI